MNNPKINRAVGYVIMFVGFILFYKGCHTYDGGQNPLLIIVGLLFVVGAFVWMMLKVRCPHCGQLLHLKLFNIDVCPDCGQKTDDI